MKKIAGRKKALLIFLLFLSLLAFGCKNDRIENMEGKSASVDNLDRGSLEILKRSENISDVVVDLIGVENASTIIFNDVAMVAVKIYNEYEDGLTEDMKETIEKTVLENDNLIKNILITDDEKILQDIEEIIYSLLNGEHIKGLTSDINKIFQKMSKE